MLVFLVRFICQFDFMNNKYDVRFIAIDLFFTFHKNPVCQFCICLLLFFFHLSLIYFVCHLNFFFCCLTKMRICRTFKLRTEWLIITSSSNTFTLLKWKWFCCCLLTLWLLAFFEILVMWKPHDETTCRLLSVKPQWLKLVTRFELNLVLVFPFLLLTISIVLNKPSLSFGLVKVNDFNLR